MEPTSKVEHITSNFVESFNGWMEELSFMPPMKLLDELKVRLMESLWGRKVTADRWNHPLPLKVCYRIRKEEKARYALVRQIWQYEFEVELHDTRVGVKLENRFCDCGY